MNGLVKMSSYKWEYFEIEEKASNSYEPEEKAVFGMYFDGRWYRLSAKDRIKDSLDPVKSLDVSILQDYLLKPILGIEDPRTDNRIDFIGGIRGLKELEKRVSEDMTVAFQCIRLLLRNYLMSQIR